LFNVGLNVLRLALPGPLKIFQSTSDSGDFLTPSRSLEGSSLVEVFERVSVTTGSRSTGSHPWSSGP